MKQRPGEKIKMLSVDELLGVPTGDPVTDILVEKIALLKLPSFSSTNSRYSLFS